MYENPEYDKPFSHSLFGDHKFEKRFELWNLVKNVYDLPYDCFWDGENDVVETFFEVQTGGKISIISNDVLAVMPNGIIVTFDILGEEKIQEWTHRMYEEAYKTK